MEKSKVWGKEKEKSVSIMKKVTKKSNKNKKTANKENGRK